jgi:hypothetical protein
VHARQLLFLCATALGLTLIVLSYGWTTLYPPAANWSEEQAARLDVVKTDLDRLYKKLAEAQLRGVAIPKDPIPLMRLLEKDAALRQQMNSALSASERTAKKLRVAGVATLGATVAIFFYGKSRQRCDG